MLPHKQGLDKLAKQHLLLSVLIMRATHLSAWRSDLRSAFHHSFSDINKYVGLILDQHLYAEIVEVP